MKHAAPTLIPILIVIGLRAAVFQPAAAVQPAVTVEPTAEIEPAAVAPEAATSATSVTGGTNRQRALARWALQRYDAAGMHLPELEIRLSGDQETCGGNQGSFTPDTTPWRVTVCTENRMTFLHEIGHAWSEANLDTAQRSSYVERRGMQSWNDPETPWRARGSEDAATTLAWGLVDDPIRCATPGGPLAQKNEAFRLLTGVDSPRLDSAGGGCESSTATLPVDRG